MDVSQLYITPSRLSGTLVIPPSKSHTMRALLLAGLGRGKSVIHNYLHSPDTEAMVRALQAYGVGIKELENTLEIEGVDGHLHAVDTTLDVGNSGQVLRFMGSMAALLPTSTVLTGDASIRKSRVVAPLLSALTQLGASATSLNRDDHAPICVRGPLQPGKAHLCGADSQPVSALLMTTSFLKGKTELIVTNPGETPWINLTLFWLKRLGAKITHHNYTHYTIEGGLHYAGFEMTIPGDFSSAAFPLVAALLTGSSLTLENLDSQDVQGDKKLIEWLSQMGAQLAIDPNRIHVLPTSSLKGIILDVNESIDSLPILAVLGCFASGTTELINAAIARHKESDRLHAITHELRKMGAHIEESATALRITAAPLHGAALSAHNDHRIAMALIVAALAAKGPSSLVGIECIAKSYPSFIADLKHVGANLE